MEDVKDSFFVRNARKITWIAVGGIVVFLVVIVGFVLKDNLKNAYLNIYITPISSMIVIDGVEYENGTYRFYPGKYEATISKDGFESKTVSLELSSGQNVNLFTFLTGENGDFSYYSYTVNADDYAVLKEVAKYEDEAWQYIDGIKEQEVIYKYLPKGFRGDGYWYAISEAKECERILCLEVRNFQGDNRLAANEQIRRLGYEPNNFQIINTDSTGRRMDE